VTRRLRTAWGAALLLAPRQVLALSGGDRSQPVVLAARLLGARHLLEGLILSSEHRRTPPCWMVSLDLVHAASMVALAAYRPRLRRDALLSASGAAALVGLSLGGR
jgi:hypothetical protein